jgi:hypothetical protein
VISSICSISDATTTAENRLALVILKGGRKAALFCAPRAPRSPRQEGGHRIRVGLQVQAGLDYAYAYARNVVVPQRDP